MSKTDPKGHIERDTADQLRQSAMRMMTEVIIVIDENGEIDYVSPNVSDIFEFSRSEVIETNDIHSLLGEEWDINAYRNAISDRLEAEWQVVTGSGVEKTLLVKISCYHKDGKCCVYVIRDVTHVKKAAIDLEYMHDLHRAMIEISSDFINIALSEIDTGINRALERIGKLSGADRSYLIIPSGDETSFMYSYEWCEEGISADREWLREMPAATLDWSLKQVEEIGYLYINDVAALPEEASNDRLYFERGSVKSLICVPLMARGDTVGFLGLDFVREKSEWNPDRIELLNLAGGIFVNALERKKLEEAYKIAEDRFRVVFATSPNSLNINRLSDGLFIDINEGFTKLTGYTKKDIIGRTSLEINIWADLADRERLRRGLQEAGQVDNLEAKFRMKDGSLKTGLMSACIIDLKGIPHILSVTRDIDHLKQVEQALKESEQYTRTIISSVREGIIVIDRGLLIKEWNDFMVELTGISVSEALGKKPEIFFPQDIGGEELDDILTRSLKGFSISPQDFTIKVPHSSGKIWVRSVFGPHSLLNGEIIGIVVTIRNVTRTKRINLKLKESEERHRAVIEQSADCIFLVDPETFRVIDANRALSRLLGYDQDELINMSVFNFLAHDPEEVRENIRSVQNQGTRLLGERRYRKKDGQIGDVEVRANRVVFSGREVISVISRDISERKDAEVLQNAIYKVSKAVDNSESLSELYISVHRIINEVMDAENFFIALYNEKENILSFPYTIDKYDTDYPPQKPGKGLTEYVIRHGRSVLCDLDLHQELEESGELELVGEPSLIWLGVPLKVENKIIGVIAVQHYHDRNAYGTREQHMLEFVSSEIAKAITHLASQEALKESESKYRSVIENSLEGIYITQKNILKFCNYKFAEMFGYEKPEDIMGIDTRELANQEELIETISSDQGSSPENTRMHYHYNFIARKIDGTEFEVEVLESRIIYDGSPAIQGVIRDVSHQKLLEEQLRQAQRMEGIGRLAGGVAHDFNNLLTVIRGNTELAMLNLDSHDPLLKEMAEVQEAANRASDLTQQLLAFSRKQTLRPQIADINVIISKMHKMLCRIIGEDINLQTEAGQDLWVVKVDPGQFEQVIINLAVNARDAMPRGGHLTISTGNVTITGKEGDRYRHIHPGEYVSIEVKDTGVGMSEDTIENIFEPFFTTKEAGKGTGLGLSMVYGIIRQSDGNIWVESSPGKGTTFRIFLPGVVDGKLKEPDVKEVVSVPRGDERILVVEDEDAVRAFTVRTLKHLGYDVIEAGNGSDALVLAENREADISMIVSDVVMPGMSGVEFTERIKKIRADIKVLFMSGYTPATIVNDDLMKSGMPFIQKPFRIKELAQKVREVLDCEKTIT